MWRSLLDAKCRRNIQFSSVHWKRMVSLIPRFRCAIALTVARRKIFRLSMPFYARNARQNVCSRTKLVLETTLPMLLWLLLRPNSLWQLKTPVRRERSLSIEGHYHWHFAAIYFAWFSDPSPPTRPTWILRASFLFPFVSHLTSTLPSCIWTIE